MIGTTVPVITIDGPAGAGKGTIASLVANRLGWHLLDSGAIYRVAALAVMRADIPLEQPIAIASLLERLDIVFAKGRAYLGDEDVSLAIRSPDCASATSTLAAMPAVRTALMARQRAFRCAPGLVADGRDMGTVVFPDAGLKVFLTASPEVRAERRYRQLSTQGISANLATLIKEIAARDKRDSGRAVAPLRPADDAVCIDSSYLTPEQVLERIIDNLHS